jgi:hypothetical protein
VTGNLVKIFGILKELNTAKGENVAVAVLVVCKTATAFFLGKS